MLNALWNKLFGFKTVVLWLDSHYEHKAVSYKEALVWAEQYPLGASVAIWNGADQLVAWRKP